VLDDAVGLVIVVGESGAGKTSLLRAGLSNVLEQAKIGYVYWEAVPTDPENSLFHAIHNAANVTKQDRSESLTSLFEQDGRTQRLVIALDQFE
jgi:ABC-type dipeptide/oligopeptide/nickel transport system ATPase subunit